MIKQSTIRKKSVELDPTVRVSRIRRDPPATVQKRAVNPYPSEREVWAVVIGITFFALGISALVVDIAHVVSN